MSVIYEEPTITSTPDDRMSDTIERHPAYAQIGASRVSGQTFLYGSDFAHQHYITISIQASELHRGLSRDWPVARQEYIEVALSEAQWATFVSTLNVGQGVQCTLNHKDGKGIPQIASRMDRKEQFQAETNQRLEHGMNELKELAKLVESLGLSKESPARDSCKTRDSLP